VSSRCKGIRWGKVLRDHVREVKNLGKDLEFDSEEDKHLEDFENHAVT
jgi:hypothetical protein